MRATCAEVVVRDAQTTALPPSALPLTADFFDHLAQTELTAVGYQVLFWHMARLIRHRTTSEAVPLETLAQALGLHRNAVGKAYAALAAAGLVRRQEVHQRGAPTRTYIEGAALQVVLQASGLRSRPTPLTGQRRTPVPVGTGRPSQLGQARAPTTLAANAQAPIKYPPPAPTVAQATPSTKAAAKKPVLSAEQQGQALAKLPPMARYDALQGRLDAGSIDSSWGLSADERTFVLGMRDRESKPNPRTAACVTPVPTTAPHTIAQALLQHRAHFEGLVNSGALSQLGQAEQEVMAEPATLVDGLLDQIAFMMVKGGLGRGDVLAGVRAARSLVAQGRWTLPWNFTRDWYGAVQRSVGEQQR